MKLKPYPKMKDSGVEWIGEIPEHWDTKKISLVFRKISSGTTPSSGNEKYYNGKIPWVITEDLNNSKITETKSNITSLALQDYPFLEIFPKGTILVALYGSIGKTGILDIQATVNQAICTLQDPINFVNEFGMYWFIAHKEKLKSLGLGGVQSNISQSIIKNLRIHVPPIIEQKKIIKFVENFEIIYTKKETQMFSLINLLNEKRKTLINHITTKGLDYGVNLKDSGISWIGKIPESWINDKLSVIADVIDSRHYTPMYVDEGIPHILPNNVRMDEIDLINTKFTNTQDYNKLIEGNRKPEHGDIVFTRNASVGVGALVQNSKMFSVGQDMVLIKPRKINSTFLHYIINSENILLQIQHLITGSTFKRINLEYIRNFRIPHTPHLDEEKRLTKYLDDKIKIIDSIIQICEFNIEKLQEFRQSLISSAVAGKIDLRNYPIIA